MVEVKKKENESYDVMLRRFGRRVQQSGVVIRSRSNRYRVRLKSRNMQRVSARRRSELRALREEIKKYGRPVTERSKFILKYKKN
ncbi:MAG TPA: hypothetical protein VEA59_05910 [Patescibacteria group bacterium]|nr:hypothetical protein [Patescibacteria group bacterium]